MGLTPQVVEVRLRHFASMRQIAELCAARVKEHPPKTPDCTCPECQMAKEFAAIEREERIAGNS